jgi:hypothetical protein
MAIAQTLENHMRKPIALSLLATLLVTLSIDAQAELYVTVVQGLSGAPEYQEPFDEQRSKIYEASNSMTTSENVTAFTHEDATKEKLMVHFANLANSMSGNDRAAIYLIGHGSYDGEQYKFNIPGPDITDEDLNSFLNALPGRNHFLVSTSSTSGALLETLENDSRTIVTATRNGNEKNATEFGAFFAQALSSETADINKNNSVSIQEAFDFAEKGVADFFESSGRLATEHPQIRGENAAQFSLARISAIETSSEIPRVTQLLEQRQALDSDIEELQLRRSELGNADYIEQLQALILESATLSEEINLLNEEALGGLD